MKDVLLGIVLAQEKPPHEEGRDIVLSMLVVGPDLPRRHRDRRPHEDRQPPPTALARPHAEAA